MQCRDGGPPRTSMEASMTTKLADIAFMALVIMVLVGGLFEAREQRKLQARLASADTYRR